VLPLTGFSLFANTYFMHGSVGYMAASLGQ
jgi:hypothetical protein